MARFRWGRIASLWLLLVVALVATLQQWRPPRPLSEPPGNAAGPPAPRPQAAAPSETATDVLQGEAAYVFDGDTLELRDGDRRWRIRLEGIDAPEKQQPFGPVARDYLAQLCLGQPIQVRVRGRDRYRRILGDVYREDLWINGQMVRAGLAWQRSRGAQQAQLDPLQREAQQAGRGLWADSQPVPPWDFRRAQND